MKGILEVDNIPAKVPMDTEKAASKTNWEVDSNMGDRFLKHDLQMQQMTENMGGIMQMIAHRRDTFEKSSPGDKNEVRRGEKGCSGRKKEIYILQ